MWLDPGVEMKASRPSVSLCFPTLLLHIGSVLCQAYVPPGSVQTETLSLLTLAHILGLTWTGEAWATCPFYSRSCGGVGQCAHWPGLGKTFLPGAGSLVLSKQEA